MTEIPAINITEVLGIRPADDGSHMLVGLKSAAGEEVVLAIGQNEVMEILSDFFQATSIVPFQKGVAAQGQDAIEVDAFEVGKVQGSPDLSLTLLRETAHVSFVLPNAMGEKLLQTLTAALAKPVPPIPAGPPV
jgi:hypothetical protein